jgi:hypothetical protein
MATVIWIGTTGGDWQSPANWSSGQVPGITDSVEITQAGGYTIDAAASTVTVASVLLNDPGAVLQAGDLSASDGLIIQAGTLQEESGSWQTLAVAGTVLANAGKIEISDGATFKASASTFQNNGTILVSAGGTLDIAADSSAWSGTGPILLDPTATLELTGSVSATAAPLNAISANGGILTIGGLFDNTGKTLVLGPSSGFGELSFASGTLIGGTLDIKGGSILPSLGTLDGVALPGSLTLGTDGDSTFRKRPAGSAN